MKVDVDATRVREVMEPVVVELRRDQSLSEVAAIFSEHSISGAPVCDAHRKVLGIVSKTDLAENTGTELARSVEDVMSRDVISVHEEDALSEAIRLMAFEGVHRLVVLDASERLSGIITSMDVLRELAGYGRRAMNRVEAVAPPEKDR